MRYIVDCHCHTIASGHAFGTVEENARAAARKGVKLIAITDHGPKMPGSCDKIFFLNQKDIPRRIDGVELLSGAEANIMDANGRMDLPDSVLKQLSVVIASLHTLCFDISLGLDANTEAVINAMGNRYVGIIGHLGDPSYPVHMESVIRAARDTETVVEINNESLNPHGFRAGGDDNIREVIRWCGRLRVPVVASSDAHSSSSVGMLDRARRLIAEAGIPDDLVLNTDIGTFKEKAANKGAYA